MPRPLVRSALLVAFMLVTLGLRPNTYAVAQDAPAGTEVLMRSTVEGTPVAPAFVRLIRIVLEPGASVPTRLHPGPEYDLVVAGTLTATTEGQAFISSADGADPAEAPTNEPFDVTAGQAVTFLPDIAFSFQNNGEEAVTLLTTVIYPAGPQRPPGISYPEGTPAPDAYEGVANQILGDGVSTMMPPVPVTVTLDRITLAAGENLPETDVPVLLSLDASNLSFAVTGGDVQVSRTARPGPQPPSDTGETYRLGSGDAIFFPSGHAAIERGEQQRPLTFLRVTLTGVASDQSTPAPSSATGDGPGSIEISAAGGSQADQPTTGSSTPEATAASDETPATTDTPAGAIPVGSTVTTNDDQINLRDAPSTGGDIVTVLDQGMTLVVISDPVDAEGYTWYEVQSLDDPNVRGFVAGDFLDIV